MSLPFAWKYSVKPSGSYSVARSGLSGATCQKRMPAMSAPFSSSYSGANSVSVNTRR